MYALWSRQTKRWYNGMDGKYHPPRPKMSKNRLMIFRSVEEAKQHLPDHSGLEIIHIICEKAGK